MAPASLRKVGHSLYDVLRHMGWVRHLALGAYLRTSNGGARQPGSGLPAEAFGKILIIRVDEIGDFVLTTALLRAVRKRFPLAHISLVVNSNVMPLARGCPHVDEVIPFRVVRAPPPFDQLVALIRARAFARQRLASGQYQSALLPRADNDDAASAAMAYYARIPLRIGYSERVLPLKRIKNAGYDSFLTHSVASLAGTHEVEWSLNLAAFAGADTDDRRLELWPSDASKASVSIRLAGFGGARALLVALAPGASLDRRRWPVSRFAAVARMLVKQRGARVVIVGGPGDVRVAERLVAEGGCGAGNILDLAGKLSLDETAAVLAECKLFIGNDSGPMHIAAAMGIPCVEISCHPQDGEPLEANSPARFSPWGVESTVLQPEHAMSPCARACSRSESHCIKQVGVERVFLATCDLLDRGLALADRQRC